MAALTAARMVAQYDGPDWFIKCPIAADAIIFHGAMVGKVGNAATGYWAPASATITPLGWADLQAWDDQSRTGQASVFAATTGQKIDNTGGADGARRMVVRRGVYRVNNKAGDLVTQVHIGGVVSVEDDQTVKATAGGSVAAGILLGFDDRDGLPLVALGTAAVSYGAA